MQNVDLRHDGLNGHNANGGAALLLEDGPISQSMRHLSLHVNDREGQITSGSCLSQLRDTCAEDKRKLAKAFSSVLPVLALVPFSARVGALAVSDALFGTHRYSVEPETTLLLRNASLPHGETESTSCG